MADFYNNETPPQNETPSQNERDGSAAENSPAEAAEDAIPTPDDYTGATDDTGDTGSGVEGGTGSTGGESDGRDEKAERKGVSGRKRKDGFFAELFDCFETFCYALVLMMILFVFVFRFVSVNGTSMTNTLQNDDKLIISNVLYTPSTGDIVVLDAEGRFGADKYIIKRVIATGGQKVEIGFADWSVRVDGRLLDESYVKKASGPMNYDPLGWIGTDPQVSEHSDEDGGVTASFTVPDGKLFVMGDNRNGSSDSRRVGFFDEASILGRVLLRVGPRGSFGRVG